MAARNLRAAGTNKFQGVNYSQVARVVSVSPSYVFLILKGRRNPTLSVARKIAANLGVSLEELADHVERSGAAA